MLLSGSCQFCRHGLNLFRGGSTSAIAVTCTSLFLLVGKELETTEKQKKKKKKKMIKYKKEKKPGVKSNNFINYWPKMLNG